MEKDKVSNIEDLCDLYYGSNRDCTNLDYVAINSYGKGTRNPNNDIGMNNSELQFRNYCLKSGINISNKVPERNNQKTPDFYIFDEKSEKVYIELKSINTIYSPDGKSNFKSSKEWIEKLNLTMKDIESKFTIGELSIGVIYIENLQIIFSKYDATSYRDGEFLFTKDFLSQTNFLKSSLDALIIFPEQVGGESENYLPVIWSKNKKIIDTFNNGFKRIN